MLVLRIWMTEPKLWEEWKQDATTARQQYPPTSYEAPFWLPSAETQREESNSHWLHVAKVAAEGQILRTRQNRICQNTPTGLEGSRKDFGMKICQHRAPSSSRRTLGQLRS